MMAALKKNGYSLLIFAVLVFLGGSIGYCLKKSLPSLVAGGLFGLALLYASVLHFTNRKWGVYLAFTLLFLLEAFFSYRVITTQSFFPAGMMLILTSVMILSNIIILMRGSSAENTP